VSIILGEDNQLPRSNQRIFTEITVVGRDKKGVVAAITNFLFKNGGNVEAVSQNVVKGPFGMHLEASFPAQDFSRGDNDAGLEKLSKKLGMDIRVHYEEPDRLKNMAVFVGKEEHCLSAILQARKMGHMRVNIPVIIGEDSSLERLSKRFGVPFYVANDGNEAKREARILDLVEKHNVDFIALARYMKILSPNFVWRYPNRIINIHPSLLPAFPGSYPYLQAYEMGAKVMGCTAHFVTMELDQGPIISQDAFKVRKNDSLESIKKRGRQLESKTLVEAIKLFSGGKLEVYWGKVHIR